MDAGILLLAPDPPWVRVLTDVTLVTMVHRAEGVEGPVQNQTSLR